MKRKSTLLAGLLLLISFGLIGYRVLWLHYPLFPNPQVKAWQLNLALNIKPDSPDKPVRIQVGLPQNAAHQAVIDERIQSGSLEANLLSHAGNRMAVWSGLIEKAEDVVEYDATVLIRQRSFRQERPPDLPPALVHAAPEDQKLVQRLAGKWLDRKAAVRLEALLDALGDVWRADIPSPADRQAWQTFLKGYGREVAFLALANATRLPTRQYEGILLAEASYSSSIRWIAVWVDNAWVMIDPNTGRRRRATEPLLGLATGGLPLVQASHAQVMDLRWTLSRQIISPWRMHL